MSEFLVRLGTPVGDIREEVFQADSVEALRRDLTDKDYYVFSVRSRSAWRLALPRMRRRGVRTEKFLIFNQELVALIRAGLPLLHALTLLLERMPDSLLRTALEDVRRRVQAGESLSEAFEAQGDLFPPIYSSSLTAGERSGELDTVIERYVDYVKKIRAVRRKVGQALVYPAVLVVVASCVISVLLTFAIPRFTGLYRDFGADLPLVTRGVMAFSRFLASYWPWILGAGLLALTAFQVGKGTPRGRLLVDRVKLRLPVLGDIVRKYSISELSRTLSILLRGGIPLVTAIDVTAGAVGNTLVRLRLREVGTEVREGRALWESLEETGVVTDLGIEMTKVGESTGALDVMLHKVSEFYDEEIDNRISTLVTLFEPLMLVVMGGIILFLLLSMYLPIFNTISAIHT